MNEQITPTNETVDAQLDALGAVLRYLCEHAPHVPAGKDMVQALHHVVHGEFAMQLVCLAPPPL